VGTPGSTATATSAGGPVQHPPPLSREEIELRDLRPRELDVLYLIAAGLSTSEIARALFLSVNTVKTHTRGLYAKLGMSTRLQVAVWVWSRCPVADADRTDLGAT
jgi:DNA-binding CsgD family transcriptional regulator